MTRRPIVAEAGSSMSGLITGVSKQCQMQSPQKTVHQTASSSMRQPRAEPEDRQSSKTRQRPIAEMCLPVLVRLVSQSRKPVKHSERHRSCCFTQFLTGGGRSAATRRRARGGASEGRVNHALNNSKLRAIALLVSASPNLSFYANATSSANPHWRPRSAYAHSMT